jgi:hypothetical protein
VSKTAAVITEAGCPVIVEDFFFPELRQRSGCLKLLSSTYFYTSRAMQIINVASPSCDRRLP